MSSFANFIAKLMQVERRKDRRAPARGVEAFYKVSSEDELVRIKDISPTGIYLVTQERWPIESDVSVILRRKGLFGKGKSSEAQMKARVTRWGEDGVGLTFVPSSITPSEWMKLLERASTTLWHHDIIRCFRSASAIAFLARICSEAHQEILLMFGDGLYHERAQRVIDIAIEAASLLPEGTNLDQIHLAPSLLLRIVESCSLSDANEILTFWSGLLASSCLTRDNLDTSMVFIDILSQLNPMQLRTFRAGCDAAVKKRWPGAMDSAPMQIFCTQEEIRKIAGIRNLSHIERDLQHLHSLGLLKETQKARLFGEIEQANITPTPFAMQLYSRCCGSSRIL